MKLEEIAAERARVQALLANLDKLEAEANRPPSPFRKLDTGIVVDTRTSLEWSPVLNADNRLDWEDAKARAEACALGGHSDWRLPTIQELLSLVDYTRTDPAIDVDAFPETPAAWFWSSSAYAADSDNAWGVSFNGGNSYIYYRSYYGFVRAVRGPVLGSARSSQ